MGQVARDGTEARPMKLPASIAFFVGDQSMRAESVGRSGARVWQIGKFYLKVGTTDEVAEEAARLRWLAGRVPVPNVIAYERVGDDRYLFTQAIDGVAAHAVDGATFRRRACACRRSAVVARTRCRRVPVRRAARQDDGEGARECAGGSCRRNRLRRCTTRAAARSIC